jgi:hypothetical protein
METPLNQSDPKFDVADSVFLGVFLFEFLVKVAAGGFCFTCKCRVGSRQTYSYLHSGWNWLDLLVLISSALGQSAQASSGSPTTVLRLFRTMRPLRMIQRNSHMRLIVTALFNSMPAILNGVILSLSFFLVFALLGVQLFRGQFRSCVLPSTLNQTYQSLLKMNIGTKSDCLEVEGAMWSAPRCHFDSLGAALLCLIEVSSLEGWISVMLSATDIPCSIPSGAVAECTLVPKPDAARIYSLFFVSFIVVCSFFVLNLFVGVIIDAINQASGSALLTEKQIKWLQIKRDMEHTMPKMIPPRPRGSVHKFCFDLMVPCSNEVSQKGCARKGRCNDLYRKSVTSCPPRFVMPLQVPLLAFKHGKLRPGCDPH